MSSPLKNFLAQLLTRHDALVEGVGEDSLEILFPPGVAEQVGIAELERFHFPDSATGNASATADPGRSGPPARVITYQSELLEGLGKLMVGQGGMAVAAVSEALPVKKLDLAHDIERALVLQNAVIRAQEQEQAEGPYLSVHFKYTALSDERREGVAAVTIDERTLNVVEGLAELVPELPFTTRPAHGSQESDIERAYARACRAARNLIQDELAEFVKSMNRRLNRDCQRVTQSYHSLQQEIEATIQRKRPSGEDLEREQARIRATDVERERKIHDLQAKYDLRVRVEAVGVLRLFVPVMRLYLTVMRLHLTVMRLHLTVMRRRWMVPVDLAWNPLLRELERVTCVGCSGPVGESSSATSSVISSAPTASNPTLTASTLAVTPALLLAAPAAGSRPKGRGRQLRDRFDSLHSNRLG